MPVFPRRLVTAVMSVALLSARILFAQPLPPTPLLIEINPGSASSSPGKMVVMDGVAYFPATDPVHGQELWRSDGTPEGTYLVADLNPGPDSSAIEYLVSTGSLLYFSATNGPSGSELWRSDGTAAGTHIVVDLGPGSSMPRHITPFGGGVIFSACQSAFGCEVWKSGGSGTMMLRNIRAGSQSSFPEHFTVLGAIVLFAANDGTPSGGEELWRTDGTTGGTVLLKNINTAPVISEASAQGRAYPSDFVTIGTTAYFKARTETNGYELWRTDGTVGGTVMVRDLTPGSLDGVFEMGAAPSILAFDTQLFFMGRTSPGASWTPYVSDGTSSGTVSTGFPGSLERAKLDEWFYFSGPGNEPWTWKPGGIGPSWNINPGGFSNPAGFVTAGPHVYFSANDGSNGTELWRVNFFEAAALIDVNPGSDSSSPSPVTRVGDYLVFSAVGAGAGTELWSVALNRAPVADAGPDQVVLSGPFTLDASNSSDPDGDELAFRWQDAGGGVIGNGETLTLELPPGTYEFTVTVRDPAWEVATDTVRVRVGNTLPSAEFFSSGDSPRNRPVRFFGYGYDADNDSISYRWDFGDGTTGTGENTEHSYPALGTFTVTLIVNDGLQDSVAATETIDIVNQPPVAHAGGPYSGLRATDIIFDGSLSSDPDNDGLIYSWDFSEGPAGTGIAPGHAYMAAGTYVVTLTVTDGNGGSSTATTTVTVTNRAPTAHAGGPYSGARNEPLAFNAAGSSDPDGDALTYAWDFGDGSTGEGVSPAHAYSSLGTFTVSLTVTDGADTSAPVTATVTVVNRDPVAAAGGPYSGYRNTPIAFNGSASTDPDGDSLTHEWQFPGGATAAGVAASHSFAELGEYPVTLVVSDANGGTHQSTITVTIVNRAPVAHGNGSYTSARNVPIEFVVIGEDADGDALTYSWDFGDGTTGTGTTPTHAYAARGSYTATVTAHDGMVASAPFTAVVIIENSLPTAHAGGPYTGTRLDQIVFNGAGSSDPDGDTLQYRWDLGDNTVGYGVTTARTFSAVGTFTVSLVVNDGQGDSAPHTSTVTITNLPPSVALVFPTNGTIVSAPTNVFFRAQAADPDDPVTKVEYFANGVKVAEATTDPFDVWWTSPAAGTYQVFARVTDGYGATVDSAPRTVTVNARPAVAITSPATGTQFFAPASVTVTANATDADGTVTQVEFFNGSTSLGVVTSSPYSITWSGVPVGLYTVTAIATDNRGATSTSAPISVSVVSSVELLASTADSYVTAQPPTFVYGTQTRLEVQQGSSNSSIKWAYLKFDLSTMPTISNARIRVYGRVQSVMSTPITMAVYPASNTTWSETSINWNNKPAPGATALATVPIVHNSATGRFYELDVTAYLQAEKAAGRQVVTLVLKNLNNSQFPVLFESRTGSAGSVPRLMITP